MSRRDSREAAVKIIFQNMFTDSRLNVAGWGDRSVLPSDPSDCAQMIETYYESTQEECGEQDKEYIHNNNAKGYFHNISSNCIIGTKTNISIFPFLIKFILEILAIIVI